MSYPTDSASIVKNLDSIPNVNDKSYFEFKQNFSSLPELVKYSINNLFNKEGGFDNTEFKGKEGDSYVFENLQGKKFFVDASQELHSLTIQESGVQFKLPSGIESGSGAFLKGENHGFKSDPESHKGIEGLSVEAAGSLGYLRGDFYKINNDGSAFKAEGRFNVLEAHGNINAGLSQQGITGDIQIGGNFFKADGSLSIITNPEPVFDPKTNEIVLEQKEFGATAGLNLGGGLSLKDRGFSMEGLVHANVINEEFSTPAKDIVSEGKLDILQKEGVINAQRELEIKILNDATGGDVSEIQQNSTSASLAKIDLEKLNTYKQQQGIKIDEAEFSGQSTDFQEHSFGWRFGEELAAFGHFVGFESSTLKSFGIDPEQLSDAGYNIRDIKNAGFTAQEFEKAGFAPSELIEKGLDINDLKDLGFDGNQLLHYGFDSDALRKAGFDSDQNITNDSTTTTGDIDAKTTTTDNTNDVAATADYNINKDNSTTTTNGINDGTTTTDDTDDSTTTTNGINDGTNTTDDTDDSTTTTNGIDDGTNTTDDTDDSTTTTNGINDGTTTTDDTDDSTTTINGINDGTTTTDDTDDSTTTINGINDGTTTTDDTDDNTTTTNGINDGTTTTDDTDDSTTTINGINDGTTTTDDTDDNTTTTNGNK